MARSKWPIKSGLSLVEVILAVALFGLFATAVVGLLVNSYGSNIQAEEKNKATLYAQEGIEAAMSIRRQAWNFLANGEYGLTKINNHWEFFGNSDLLEDKYTRMITVADGCRNASGDIVDCTLPGAIVDLHTKKVTSQVTYTTVTGVGNDVELTTYLTTWQSRDWQQTDWSGGSDQNIWSNITRYSSDDGNVDVSSETGKVTLKLLDTGGCGVKKWSFSTTTDYSYDSDKIEITSGMAQLKGSQTCAGTPTACGDYANQPLCQAQGGCTWVSGGCQNIGSCSAETSGKCNNCSSAGCSRVGSNCIGSLNCPTYTDQTSCEVCGQCAWAGTPSCTGTAAACSGFSTQLSCQAQSGCLWNSTFSTSANINPIVSYSVSNIDAWTSFTETATKNGGEIYYQLSNDDGLTWYYWNGAAWITAGVSNYNTASVINANISGFTTAEKNISFKAFLIGDGSQQVSLDEVSISCAQYYDWPFLTPGDYQYDSDKIEVTGGYAQLKGQSSADSGNTTNANFDSTLSPWVFGSWGLITSSGSWTSTGGHPAGYAKIQFPSRRNYNSGGYFEQAFTVTAQTISSATLNLDWAVTQYNRTARSLNLYAFVDTVSGAPVIGQQVWSSGNVSGARTWATASNVNVASKITSPGTYYLKIAAYVNYPTAGANATYAVGFDNVLLSWSDLNSSYPADNPTISPATAATAAALDSWTSFTETATKNGGEIYYQLSSDGGTTWQYWNGAAWIAAGTSDYNIASIVNSNISKLATTTSQVSFKAFLAGDGSQQVKLNNVQIGWGQSAGSGYATLGSLVSSAYGISTPSSFNIISWSEDTSSCAPSCAAKLQVRTAPDSGGSPGSWTAWYGSSGVDSYFTNGGETPLPNDFNFNQWVQYRVELSGDGLTTPIFQDIKINYTP